MFVQIILRRGNGKPTYYVFKLIFDVFLGPLNRILSGIKVHVYHNTTSLIGRFVAFVASQRHSIDHCRLFVDTDGVWTLSKS